LIVADGLGHVLTVTVTVAVTVRYTTVGDVLDEERGFDDEMEVILDADELLPLVLDLADEVMVVLGF
jgi:hypothetical protein